MEKLVFLYEVIENIKHISSFELIYKLIKKRLKENFFVNDIYFMHYDAKKKIFFFHKNDKPNFKEQEYYINQSKFLSDIIENHNSVEIIIDNIEKDNLDDIFKKEIVENFKGICEIHPVVLKDKVFGIFIINSTEKLDYNFLYSILDIMAIAFQRIILSGHLIFEENVEENLEDKYLKEILQNEIIDCDLKKISLSFSIISISYDEKIELNMEIFLKVFYSIKDELNQKDIIIKSGDSKILIIQQGKDEKETLKILNNIKNRIENNVFSDFKNGRNKIKLNFGYSVFPSISENIDEIYNNAIIMLNENIKIEKWIKEI